MGIHAIERLVTESMLGILSVRILRDEPKSAGKMIESHSNHASQLDSLPASSYQGGKKSAINKFI